MTPEERLVAAIFGQPCSGASDCPAPVHEHGCYADVDGSSCTDPGDHQPVPASDPTREELIALCERAAAAQESTWSNRDSAGAQRQLGEAWALLKSGCEFEFRRDMHGFGIDTWWIEITYRGFNWFEGTGDPYEDRDALLGEDLAYIPTTARLDKVDGGDWY